MHSQHLEFVRDNKIKDFSHNLGREEVQSLETVKVIYFFNISWGILSKGIGHLCQKCVNGRALTF